MLPPKLPSAGLVLRQGVPYSERFGDIYYSEDGLAETRYVFLEANDLPARWREASRFVVAETGFGTGLNFLATWRLWRETAPPAACLHYISVEHCPLNRDELARVLELWPELRELRDALLAVYPERLPGFHRLSLDGGRLRLTLIFDEAEQALPRLDARVDAWFLDGFAPARNSDMWSEALITTLAGLTRRGGTLSSFTAASHVRRKLEAAGFSVERRAGFARKREMLRAVMPHEPQRRETPPWYTCPSRDAAPGRHVAIIGAGIAGVSTAHALAGRGWRVSLIERGPNLAGAASGNPAGVLMPALTADYKPATRYYLEAFRYTVALIGALIARGANIDWQACGVLQLGFDETVRRSHERVMTSWHLPDEFVQALGREAASAQCGARSAFGGLYFPGGGWLSPVSLCAALLEEAGERVECRFNAQVDALLPGPPWRLMDRDGQCLAEAEAVVIANGEAAAALPPCNWLPLTPVRGQLSYLPPSPLSERLQSVVCYKGYVTPAIGGRHIVGASYARNDTQTDLHARDHERNIARLRAALPDILDEHPPELIAAGQLPGRAALRATTPDRLPALGPLPDLDYFEHHYADLYKGRRHQVYPPARHLPGLYVNVGHSSRGLISAPLAAEILASRMNAEPMPLETGLLDALNPARFIIRRLRKHPAD